jgi:hypothetical protein
MKYFKSNKQKAFALLLTTSIIIASFFSILPTVFSTSDASGTSYSIALIYGGAGTTASVYLSEWTTLLNSLQNYVPCTYTQFNFSDSIPSTATLNDYDVIIVSNVRWMAQYLSLTLPTQLVQNLLDTTKPVIFHAYRDYNTTLSTAVGFVKTTEYPGTAVDSIVHTLQFSNISHSFYSNYYMRNSVTATIFNATVSVDTEVHAWANVSDTLYPYITKRFDGVKNFYTLQEYLAGGFSSSFGSWTYSAHPAVYTIIDALNCWQTVSSTFNFQFQIDDGGLNIADTENTTSYLQTIHNTYPYLTYYGFSPNATGITSTDLQLLATQINNDQYNIAGLHGTRHEVWGTMTLSEQQARLAEGITLFEQYFDYTPRYFIPPYESLDNNTLTVLQDNRFGFNAGTWAYNNIQGNHAPLTINFSSYLTPSYNRIISLSDTSYNIIGTTTNATVHTLSNTTYQLNLDQILLASIFSNTVLPQKAAVWYLHTANFNNLNQTTNLGYNALNDIYAWLTLQYGINLSGDNPYYPNLSKQIMGISITEIYSIQGIPINNTIKLNGVVL